MGNVVTYNGPKAEADASTNYLVPTPDGDFDFAIGVPVSDVPDSVVASLKADDVAEAHEFDFGSSKSRLKADAQAEANALGVEFTDKTTVPELEDLIVAAKAAQAEAP